MDTATHASAVPTPYTHADVARATKLAEVLRRIAAEERALAVDVDQIVREIPAITLGAREWDYSVDFRARHVPRPTHDGLEHIALVTDALRAREHALTRSARVLDATAFWLEESAKAGAPAPAAAPPALVEATTTADVASEG